jgi:Domain of unknown function (DUF4279)
VENENYLEGKLNLDKTQVKAYFTIYGDDFPIDYVNESLGIEPTDSYYKGDIIARPLNQNTPQFRKETAWQLSTDYQESYDVKEQMNQILIPLKNKAEVINQLKNKYKLKCDFSIVVIIENGETPGLHLDLEIIEFTNSIGAEFDIDLYANPYNDTFED